MKQIKKGNKSQYDGVILTIKEYEDYKKLLELVNVLKTYKKDYKTSYYSNIM